MTTLSVQRQRVPTLVLCLLFSLSAQALRLPSIFGDHMVLQQDKAIQVWGWAEPGEAVRVKLGRAREKATADETGRWQVTLPAMTSSRPLTMKVRGADETLTFEDILLGEVWICSGQSNMQWSVERANNATLEIERADHPELRLFTVPRKIAAEPQEDCAGSWEICTPETVPGFSAVGYFYGRELHTALDVPVGMIHTSWGGTPAEAWTPMESLLADPVFAPVVAYWDTETAKYNAAMKAFKAEKETWEAAVAQAKAEGKEAPPEPKAPRSGTRSHWRPSGLYNAMITPLVPYTIQGAIWYQGESNASRAWQYRTLFPTMINDWRSAWDQGPFPFLFVQLANFLDREAEPGGAEWAELREAQVMTLDACENTGQAVAIDLGVARDIHPRNKQEVARRLALNALANTYGQDIPYSGPMYAGMEKQGNRIVVSFDHTDYGLQSYDQGRLAGFAIAGEDRKFVWAQAKIVDDKVEVWSDEIADPVAVRYGWATNPECNLYNGVGLPASPFRTDDWPGITVEERVRKL